MRLYVTNSKTQLFFLKSCLLGDTSSYTVGGNVTVNDLDEGG